MPTVTLIVLAAAHLEDPHLVAQAVRQHLGFDRHARKHRRADLQVCTVADGQNLVDHDLLSDLGGDLLNPDSLPGGDLVLLAAGLDDRIHAESPIT